MTQLNTINILNRVILNQTFAFVPSDSFWHFLTAFAFSLTSRPCVSWLQPCILSCSPASSPLHLAQPSNCEVINMNQFAYSRSDLTYAPNSINLQALTSLQVAEASMRSLTASLRPLFCEINGPVCMCGFELRSPQVRLFSLTRNRPR